MSTSVPSTQGTATTGAAAPLSARELDRLLPGALDGINIMAGGANVIMQLAWPAVGYGVKESRVETGNLFRHPIKRTRTTITYLAVAMLGTTDERQAYREAVNTAHAQVNSTATSPVKYNAFDPALQLWVAACLYYGFIDACEKFRGGPTAQQAAAFYKAAAPLGTTLQVRPDMWPADPEAFHAYWEHGLRQVHIDDTIRTYLTGIADLAFLPAVLRIPFRRFNRLVTAGFLPEAFRQAMKFDWGPVQQRRFDRATRVISLLNRALPRIIRQAPFLLVMRDFRRRLRKGLPMV